MESTPKAEVAEIPVAATGGERSTIDFSYTDLDNAVEIVKAIHAVGGTACDYDQLAAQLNVEAKGGGFRLRVNGAKTFGFITYERGGRITLTDLGNRVLDPDTEKAARVEAFLNVPLYSKVYETFKGRPLPPQAGLERQLITFGVGNKVADRARQSLSRSAKQAGFFDMAADRLVQPVIKTNAKTAEVEPETAKQPNTGGGGGGGNGFDNVHPLIKGMFETLPQSGANWTQKDQLDWLVMANSILKIVYKTPADGGEIKITVEGPKPAITPT